MSLKVLADREWNFSRVLLLRVFSFFTFNRQYLKKIIIKRIYETNISSHNINCSSYNRKLSINAGITFAQEKNETSEIDDSGLITTTEIDESMETNNTLSQTVNDTS